MVSIAGVCVAPQYVSEELLRSEGFTDVQYVKLKLDEVYKAFASGAVDISMAYAPPFVIQIDAGEPIVLLGGVHAGCFELFGTDRVRAIRDLKGKTVAIPALGSPHHVFLAFMAAYVGIDPRKDINWVIHPVPDSMRLLADKKIDALMGFPPVPQELRAKKIGHVVVNSGADRPWSQYFCCVMASNREFVRKHPAATKRAMRAILKANQICALEPERAARLLVDKGFTTQLRLCPSDNERNPLRQVAGVRSRGQRALLLSPPPRGGHDQVEPAEDYRPGHGLAVFEGTEERVESVKS